MTRKALLFVEIDLDYCSRSFGVGACTAQLTSGETADAKCFNTLATCRARAAFNNAPVTLRFGKGSGHLAEAGIDCLPLIEDVSFTPPTVSLGENLGTRASLSVTFSDQKWPDTGIGFDKYVGERSYDPFELGTFWGKFRARHPYLRGRAMRLIRGFVGQSLAEMETRHFLIEAFEGPALNGRYSITAKDALKLADDDRAQAPRPNLGYLIADIGATDTTAQLGPVGIGNLDYPASGHMNLGGKEIVRFTRSGDTLTLTRGRYNTEPVEHKAQDRAQVCLEIVGRSAAWILRHLFRDFAAVPSSFIPFDDWADEVGTFLNVLYSRLIPEPTGVNKLASELNQQAGLAVWWDDIARQLRLRVLRPVTPDAALFDDSTILAKSLRITDQPEKRLSQVWVYYGQVNPLLRVDEATNYRSMHVEGDLAAEADYGQPAIKKIHGAWIPEFARVVAERAGQIQLGQNVHAPRKMAFETFRSNDPVPELGMECNVSARPLQTPTGARDLVPFMINRITPSDSGYMVEGMETRFKEFAPDLGDRTIVISTNVTGLNLRTIYNRQFPAPTQDDEVIFIVNSGVVIASTSNGTAALTVGSWPSGVVPILRLRGRLRGAGGNGGAGRIRGPGHPGGPGGTALLARSPIRVELQSGNGIWGGGGGGGGGAGTHNEVRGGSGGGGGAGIEPGRGGARADTNGYSQNGRDGTPTAGGSGGAGGGASWGSGGNGGAPGQPGQSGGSTNINGGGAAGRAGYAIDGNSFVTLVGSGDIRGPRVN